MGTYILIGVGVLVLLFVFWLIGSYNTLVKARNRVNAQWAQIDVQLTRRAELIPNLVECVKGYAKHETEVLELVTQAHAAMTKSNTPKEAIAANSQLSKALSGIFALAEAYPDLKADRNFAQLQTELSETESKVAYARQFYNDTVMLYRDKIGVFPCNITASLFGFKQEAFFEADEENRKSVQVKF